MYYVLMYIVHVVFWIHRGFVNTLLITDEVLHKNVKKIIKEHTLQTDVFIYFIQMCFYSEFSERIYKKYVKISLFVFILSIFSN